MNKLNWHQNLFLTRQIKVSPDPVDNNNVPHLRLHVNVLGGGDGQVELGDGVLVHAVEGRGQSQGMLAPLTEEVDPIPRPRSVAHGDDYNYLKLFRPIVIQSLIHCDWWSLHDEGQLSQRIICVQIQFRPGPPQAVDKSFINSG